MTAAIAMTAFLLALTPWVMTAIPTIKAFKRTRIAASAKPLIVTGLAVILASYIIGFIMSFAERVADLPDVISIGDALSNSAYIARWSITLGPKVPGSPAQSGESKERTFESTFVIAVRKPRRKAKSGAPQSKKLTPQRQPPTLANGNRRRRQGTAKPPRSQQATPRTKSLNS